MTKMKFMSGCWYVIDVKCSEYVWEKRERESLCLSFSCCSSMLSMCYDRIIKVHHRMRFYQSQWSYDNGNNDNKLIFFLGYHFVEFVRYIFIESLLLFSTWQQIPQSQPFFVFLRGDIEGGCGFWWFVHLEIQPCPQFRFKF